MRENMFRFKRGDTYPVLDGFIYIALVEEEVGSSEGEFDSFFKTTGTLEQLRELFHGGGVLGGDLRDAFIDLQ